MLEHEQIDKKARGKLTETIEKICQQNIFFRIATLCNFF